MTDNRVVVCPEPDCGREIEVRSGMFAHETLANHYYKEHKKKTP